MELKKYLKIIIFAAVFIIGLVILVNSIKMGRDEASNILRMNGGSMDTTTYLIYVEQSIIKNRVVGSIISVLGGLGLIVNTRNERS